MSDTISRRVLLAAGAGAATLAAQYPKSATATEGKLAVRQDRVVLDVLHDGSPLAVYNYDTTQAGTYRPYFHPVMGPGNRVLTQNGEFPGSLRGHHWHRGLFIAHQKVNDCSFWEERVADCGKIVHLGFEGLETGAVARFRERLAWRDLRSRDLLHETRSVRAGIAGPHRYLDIGIRLSALDQPVIFRQSLYNLLACRAPDSMCLQPQKERYTKLYGPLVNFEPLDKFGTISNSEGKLNEACGGAKAKWCDFSGPLADRPCPGRRERRKQVVPRVYQTVISIGGSPGGDLHPASCLDLCLRADRRERRRLLASGIRCARDGGRKRDDSRRHGRHRDIL